MFTTEPAIVTDKLVSLADPKFNFAAQNVIPLVYKPDLTPTITEHAQRGGRQADHRRPAAAGHRGRHRQAGLHHRRAALAAVRRPELTS